MGADLVNRKLSAKQGKQNWEAAYILGPLGHGMSRPGARTHSPLECHSRVAEGSGGGGELGSE